MIEMPAVGTHNYSKDAPMKSRPLSCFSIAMESRALLTGIMSDVATFITGPARKTGHHDKQIGQI